MHVGGIDPSPRSGMCVLYVAFSYEYFIMAVNSARSVRDSGGHAHLKLVTNVPVSDVRLRGRSVFDEIDVHDAPDDENRAWKIDLPSLTEHEYNLYLDADTEVYRPVQRLLPLLDRFDLALRSLPYATPKKYEIFPGMSTTEAMVSEYNGGVILFRKTPATVEFFRVWQEQFHRLGLGLDQPALLHAAFSPHPASIGPLGAAWNVKPTPVADLGLLRERPHEIAILHYREGFAWPRVGRNLAEAHRSVELEWTRRAPEVDEQVAEYGRRAAVLGSPLSGNRMTRKLLSFAYRLQSRWSGQGARSPYKVRARKAGSVERTDGL